MTHDVACDSVTTCWPSFKLDFECPGKRLRSSVAAIEAAKECRRTARPEPEICAGVAAQRARDKHCAGQDLTTTATKPRTTRKQENKIQAQQSKQTNSVMSRNSTSAARTTSGRR